MTGGPKSPGPAGRLAKAVAWKCLGMALHVVRLGSDIAGRTRRFDVLVYKVDRLGDWLLAEPSIVRIVEAARKGGGTVVVWTAHESDSFRDWRPPGFKVESFALEPRGLIAKLWRACAVVRLLAVYRARTLICLRHSPDSVRDFVLSHAAVGATYALSRYAAFGPPALVPHEIARHFAILAAAGLAPSDARDLLPRLPGRKGPPGACVVLAPFSSAPIKDWRDEGWCDVVAGLDGRGMHFELWVGPDQVLRAEVIARMLAERAPNLRLAVKSGALAGLAEAVGSAALVLTVDTFAAHLAAALNAPMVCMIGGGHYGDFGPWHRSERQRWVTHHLPCFGCDWHCSRKCVECLVDITPSEILAEAEAVLGTGGR